MTDGIEMTIHVHCIECYNYIALHSHIGFAKGTAVMQIAFFLTVPEGRQCMRMFHGGGQSA